MTIDLAQLEARVYRAPIGTPVRTAFGVMHDRPAVLVRAVDADGAEGWGEVWCNFPSVGAEHRARLVLEVAAPLLVGRCLASPREAFERLDRLLALLAVQTGEPGPLAQATAGIDIALWDLAARRLGKPLYRALGAADPSDRPVYASGLNPEAPERLALRKRDEGHTAFKLKVGFGRDTDLANLTALRGALGSECMLMVDANQAWDVETASAMSGELAACRPAWLEEPLRADAPSADWRRLAGASPIPLAAGENLRGPDFGAVVEAGALCVLQPDIGKWGGFTGGLDVARTARGAGLRLCPHWLGGGIGLAASLHFLAAAGGDGLLEVDSNDNPLRDLMAADLPRVRDGRMALPAGPGLGVAPDLAGLKGYEVAL